MKKFFGRALLLAAALALGANSFAFSACDAAVGPHEHIYGAWTVERSATCSENGLRVHTCAVCNASDEEEIPALGHDFDGGRETKAASCSQSGERTQTCRRCGFTKTTDVPTISHNWDGGVILVKPTCEQEGSMRLTCKDCSVSQTVSLGFGAHDPVETGRVNATCETAGSISYRCNTCKNDLDDVEIPALGHRWKLGADDVEPTCTGAGYRDRVCERCNTPEKKIIPALGHELPAQFTVDQLPTFDAAGSKSQHCLRCSEHVNPTEIPKLDENVPVEYEFRLLRNNGEAVLGSSAVITVSDGATTIAQSDPSTLINGVFRYAIKPVKNKTYTVTVSSLPKGYSAEPVEMQFGNPYCDVYLTAAPIREPVPAGTRYTVGSVMYDFTLTPGMTSDGRSYNLYDLLQTKKAVVLNFWATWCGPCRLEFPYLQQGYVQLQDEIELLAVDQDAGDDLAKVQAFAAELGCTFPMAYDPVNRLQSMFGVTDIPTTVVIDSEGVVCEVHTGYMSSQEQFLSLLSPYLKEKGPAAVSLPREYALPQKRALAD